MSRSPASAATGMSASVGASRLSFIPLPVVDLCRYRDYADIIAGAWSNAAFR